MQYPTVEGVRVYEKYTVLIAAKTAAETTKLLELRNHINYTFTCSTLGASEEILGEIYDITRSVWQPWMVEGNRVKLMKDYEQIHITQTTALVRFIKPVTAQDVGFFVAHPQ
jgi:hypothetical protein